MSILFGLVELYCGSSGKIGYYNNQQIGLAKALRKLGYECIVFFPDLESRRLKEEKTQEGITVVRCPAIHLGGHSRYDWNVLVKYKIDVVEIGGDNQIFTASIMRFCDKHNIIICSYNGALLSDSKNFLKRLFSHIFLHKQVKSYQTHKIFAKTEHIKKQMEKEGIKDISIAPVGLDVELIDNIKISKAEMRKELYLPQDKEILLFVGRMDAYKKPDQMIELASELPEDYYVVIIGDGSLSKKIENRIINRGIENKICRIKRLPNREVQKFYYASDYFLNFNEEEIFGMAILEAMYQGCTVIAAHAPGPDTIIENGVSGFLVDNLDETKRIIIDNRKLNKEQVRRRITDHFLWDKTALIMDEWVKETFRKK